MRTHYPVPKRGLPTGGKALAVKAHGRACVVLLSSHLDRYVYAINEEAIDWLNSQLCTLANFSENFLLQHSKNAVDDLANRSWEKRGTALRSFVASHGPVWAADGTSGSLDAGAMLAWMKSPTPESLERFYRLYGVSNIFGSVTRKPFHSRSPIPGTAGVGREAQQHRPRRLPKPGTSHGRYSVSRNGLQVWRVGRSGAFSGASENGGCNGGTVVDPGPSAKRGLTTRRLVLLLNARPVRRGGGRSQPGETARHFKLRSMENWPGQGAREFPAPQAGAHDY